MQFVIPIAIVGIAYWLWGKGKSGPKPGPTPLPEPDPPGPVPEPNPEKNLTSDERAELATLLSGLGYPATPNDPSIPYSTRVVWVQDFRKVRGKVVQKAMTRVWPLGSPAKQKRVNAGLSKASLAAAKWAYGTQSAGIAWNSLVEQARSL